MKLLSERIASALDASGHSAADLARACGVKPPSVSDWLSGETKALKADSLLKAASFLEVNALWLSSGVGPRRPGQSHPSNVEPLRVEQPGAVYYADQWPFKRIPFADFAKLSAGDRDFVEGNLAAAIALCASRESGKRHRQ